MHRAHRCTAEDILVEVTRLPAIQGQDVWPIAPSNIREAEHAAVMCRALQGHAAALPRAPAAQSSSNRPAASLALLHSVSRAWCWVVAALEPHSSALRLYDRGKGTVLTVHPADLEALHLSALSGDGGERAVPPRDRGRRSRDTLPPAERRRCPPPGHGGEHGAVAPGVLHVLVEGRE